ncbi:hypothetical protein THIOSC15_720002 [uncultured Thiomicrorhabdus sp.]
MRYETKLIKLLPTQFINLTLAKRSGIYLFLATLGYGMPATAKTYVNGFVSQGLIFSQDNTFLTETPRTVLLSFMSWV